MSGKYSFSTFLFSSDVLESLCCLVPISEVVTQAAIQFLTLVQLLLLYIPTTGSLGLLYFKYSKAVPE